MRHTITDTNHSPHPSSCNQHIGPATMALRWLRTIRSGSSPLPCSALSPWCH